MPPHRLPPVLSSALLAVSMLLAVAAPAAAQERSLRWEEIAVEARLDATGTLHVRERQTFVFNGDWNGGERAFRLGFQHDLELQRLSRVGPDGREIPLTEGELERVDEYGWADNNTLRWRSRLPSDPPFQETRITYVLDYTLEGILTRDGDVYLLDHNFGLPDAEWPIERFTLDFELDPAWQPLTGVPAHLEETNLPPGSDVLVTARLEATGAAAPRPGVYIVPLWQRRAVFAAALLAMGLLYADFRRREARRGRFDPLPVPPDWDEAWLQENVFNLRAEEVGALWDLQTGPPEVAALLARLVAEGKLESEVRPGFTLFGFALTPGVLHLRLLVERHELAGYERKLIDKLFEPGSEVTDTESVSQRYRSSGFNPAKVIEEGLTGRLKKKRVLEEVKLPGRRRTLYLSLAAVALLAVEIVLRVEVGLVAGALFVFGLFWLALIGLAAAAEWRRRTERLDLVSLTFVVPVLLALVWAALLVFHRELFGWSRGLAVGLPGILGLALACVALWSSVLNNARSQEKDQTLERRRRLAAGRRMLLRELESPEPRLRDEWLPYLLAFGLGKNVDRWFRAFGGGAALRGTGFGTDTASSGGGSTWSGGGGSFGGAGATGAWAVAATGMAAGVSSPGSGSSGGGGGGGGSSGGGGGGGW